MIRDLYDNSIVAYKTATQQTVNLVLDTIRLAMKCEKVNIHQLILKFVFFKLVLDILCDLFGIFTYCVYLVTSAPKRSVAVLVFQICMPLMYEQTAFFFEKSHEA